VPAAVDPKVSKARIPSVELKHHLRRAPGRAGQVSKARIPSVELKLDERNGDDLGQIGVKGQNSERGIETRARPGGPGQRAACQRPEFRAWN